VDTVWIPAFGSVDLVAGGYRLVGTASANPYGDLTINQLPPPSEGPECGTAALGCEADRPQTTSKRENDRDMSYVPSAGQRPDWTRRWSLPAPQPSGDSGPSTAHRAAVPHCSRRYGYYQVVGNWRPVMSKSTGPFAGMTVWALRAEIAARVPTAFPGAMARTPSGSGSPCLGATPPRGRPAAEGE